MSLLELESADGSTRLRGPGGVVELCAGDLLQVAFGGLGAAIGEVRIEVWLRRGGEARCLLSEGVDAEREDPEALRDALERTLREAARTSGAQLVPRPAW